MQSRLVFIGIALLLGAILPIQAAINTRLSKSVGGSIPAAFVSFAVGTIALLLYLLLTRQFNLQQVNVQQSPWWIWTGGLLGTFFVAGIVAVLPKLGTVLAFSLVLGGQMIVAIILDHFGLLGVSVREISAGRVAGVILLIISVVMIRKF